MKVFRLFVVPLAFTLAITGKVSGQDEPIQDWGLLQELRTLPASVRSGESYRLGSLTKLMQLVRRTGSGQPVMFTAIPKEGGRAPNVRIDRMVNDVNFESPKDTGPFVLLNEPVALFFEGAGFLVYDKRASGSRLKWQADAHFNPLSRDRDVYQWRFEVPRDHRRRALKTKERLALFNTLRNAYLRSSKNDNRLRWHRE